MDINRPGSEGIDWGSPLGKQYGVHSLPSFKIYGPRCTMILDGRPAYEDVMTAMQADMES